MTDDETDKPLGEDLGMHMLPLLDVMFLLLCFFIYAITMMVLQQGMIVELASAESAQQTPEQPNQIVLTVDESGKLFWNDKAVNQDQLQSRLAGLKETVPVVLQADRNARHHHVIEVLDLVRKHELAELIFAVEQPSE